MLNILEVTNEDGAAGYQEASTSTGTSKKKTYNKLPPGQYDDLREASAAIVKNAGHGWELEKTQAR